MSELFEKAVRSGQKIYKSKNNKLLLDLKLQIEATKHVNKNLVPYVNNNYRCNTCGVLGQSHPETSYCFICNTDNW